MWKTVRVERGRKRIKFTGLKCHRLYGFSNFIFRNKMERREMSARDRWIRGTRLR